MRSPLLSLGDILTFIGLVLAAFQLMKPRHSLIWKLSSNLLKWTAMTLLAIGYLSPLVSIVTPDSKPLWDELTLDQLLEIGGFTAITLGLLIVVFIYSRYNYRRLIISYTKYRLRLIKYPGKKWRSIHLKIEHQKIISTHSARKFYEITSLFLIRGHVEEVVEITRLNLKPLVLSAKQYVPDRPGSSDSEKKKAPKPNGSNYAFEILYQLLTDQAVMKHICTKNRVFLHAIISYEVNDYYGSARNKFTDILYSSIVEHLVLNNESFLYTQKDTRNGTARFTNVYDLLTHDKIVRRLQIIPSMLTWNVGKTDIRLDEYTDVLLKLLERMVNSYKKQPESAELLANIRQVLDQLIGDEGVTSRLAYDQKAKREYIEDSVGSMGYKVLSKIHLAMRSDLLFMSNDPANFKTNVAELKSENKQSTYDQETLTGLLAHKVYELIEDLITFYQDTDDPDGNLVRATYSYISIHTNTPVAKHYKELLWSRLFDKAVDGKIEQYDTNIEGYYPNVFRFIVKHLVPFREHQINSNPEAVNKLKSIMANELRDALLANKKMTNGELMKNVLLPSNVRAVVNKTAKTVRYKYVDGKGKTSIIDLSKPRPRARVSTSSASQKTHGRK